MISYRKNMIMRTRMIFCMKNKIMKMKKNMDVKMEVGTIWGRKSMAVGIVMMKS